MALFKSRPPASLLGLTLEGRQLEGVVLSRTNGTLKAQQSFRTSLSLDPLTNDPELVGREIRNHLDEAGIREHRCVVCVPLTWALTVQTKVPEMPEADTQSYLELEAERGFPYAPADLSMGVSRYQAPNKEQHAFLVAIPKSHLDLLEKALRAARLKPRSFSLGISVLRSLSDPSETGLLTLAVGETGIEIEVVACGGVAALRSLEGAIEIEGAERRVDVDLVAREIRITLGQLPKEIRETVNRIHVFGPAEFTGPLVKDMIPVARDMGLLMGLGATPHIGHLKIQDTNPPSPAAALCLAATCLGAVQPEFEFLPARQSAWKQVITRFSTGKMLYAGAAAGAILLLAGGAFMWQQIRLASLESQWRAIRPTIEEIDLMQQQARKFRPWFDESARSLRMIKRITEAFPEEGNVTAKTVEIKDLAEVTCTGQARDNQAWLGLLERLGKAPQITDLKVQQISGKSPLKFTLNFRWTEGATREN